MNMKKEKRQLKTDYLILGSGIAGLFAAIKLAELGTVTIITKDELKESNSSYAQGGIAAALIPPDSAEKHFNDTMKAGDFHNNQAAVKVLTKEGPERVRELIELGVNFDMQHNELHLSKEGAHSEARVLHHKDFTGAEIINILIKHVRKNPKITIHESLFVYQLLKENNKCTGCLCFDDKKHIHIQAKATILATGGAGKLYKFSSNPDVSTGDGYILGHDINCELNDMEFIQFHPTTFLHDPKKSHVFLVTEALRGDGAYLVNENNEQFMKLYDPKENLASRDIVSRAIFKESDAGKKKVYLNCSKIKHTIKKNYPTIYSFCLTKNIDISKENIPITPAAHYMMGGIKTNLNAETNINHLYAVGEVACTGVHGSNRLASNSLLEAIVFAQRAVDRIKNKTVETLSESSIVFKQLAPCPLNLKKIQQEIQQIMWENAGIIRTQKNLNYALNKLSSYSELYNYHELNKDFFETINMIKLSKLIIQSSINRTESIGAHFIL